MRAIKALGQNFLRDNNIIDKIIKVLAEYPRETILEVGPGKGAFTKKLAQLAPRLISVEKDHLLVTELAASIASQDIINTEVIHDDILSFNPSSVIKSHYSLFGSLPYNISKRIIRRFLTEVDHKPTNLHVIVQREVADQYCAKPPKSTYLSNFAHIYSTVDYHFTISKNSFSPTPAVDGAFITFTRIETEPDHRKFDAFIRSMFKKPRKTIRNNLKYEYSPHAIDESRFKIDLTRRPAELSIPEFRKLFIVYNTQYTDGEEQKAKGATVTSRS